MTHKESFQSFLNAKSNKYEASSAPDKEAKIFEMSHVLIAKKKQGRFRAGSLVTKKIDNLSSFDNQYFNALKRVENKSPFALSEPYITVLKKVSGKQILNSSENRLIVRDTVYLPNEDLIVSLEHPNATPEQIFAYMRGEYAEKVYWNTWPENAPASRPYTDDRDKILPFIDTIKMTGSNGQFLLNWIAQMVQFPQRNHRIVPHIVAGEYNVYQFFDVITQLISNNKTANAIDRSELINGEYSDHLVSVVSIRSPLNNSQQQIVLDIIDSSQPNRLIFLSKTNTNIGLAKRDHVQKLYLNELPPKLDVTPKLLNQLYSFFMKFEINEHELYQKPNQL